MTDQTLPEVVSADAVPAFGDETGRSVALRRCTCGQENDLRALFCVHCGAVLRQSAQAAPPTTQALPWGIADVVIVGIGGLMLSFIPVIIDALLSGGIVQAVLQNKSVELPTGFMLRSVIFQNVVLVGVCFFWLWALRRQSITALGLCRTHWRTWLWQGVGAGVVIFGLGELIPYLTHHALLSVGISSDDLHLLGEQSPQVKLIDSILKSSVPMKVFAVFVIAVVAPAGEEIFFRGFAYQGIRNRLGAKWGAVLSSLAFAALHTNLPAFVAYFVLGLVLVWLFQRTQSLTAPILAHGVNNFISVMILLMAR
ncbi:MAG: CPBP family glutamic-type intramembrane protease [Abditibacteriales bacterium]|nr:CPBP family glutamic-type intramembrane protease [Abditibacteriales bacterium]MDW8367735.1 CPBP family intramembrane glutamic endopeptidase [Abditibacteriales bacterium]